MPAINSIMPEGTWLIELSRSTENLTCKVLTCLTGANRATS